MLTNYTFKIHSINKKPNILVFNPIRVNLIIKQSVHLCETSFIAKHFISKVLHKYPDLNPSFILYNPLMYEVDNQKTEENLQGLVKGQSFDNIENTQEIMAFAMILGGKTCYEHYLKHPNKSYIILGIIKEFINNKS